MSSVIKIITDKEKENICIKIAYFASSSFVINPQIAKMPIQTILAFIFSPDDIFVAWTRLNAVVKICSLPGILSRSSFAKLISNEFATTKSRFESRIDSKPDRSTKELFWSIPGSRRIEHESSISSKVNLWF